MWNTPELGFARGFCCERSDLDGFDLDSTSLVSEAVENKLNKVETKNMRGLKVATPVLLLCAALAYIVSLERTVSDFYGRLDGLASRQTMLEDEAARAFWRGRIAPVTPQKGWRK